MLLKHKAVEALRAAGVETPEVDVEWLLAHVLGVSRSEAVVRELDDEQRARFAELLARRARREPLQYVIGEWDFRRLTLKVDPRALIPRPETEIVVERTLALLGDGARVLDVGVGSGAIALAIKDEAPSAHVVGVDTSPEALELAGENARRLGLDVELREGGLETAAEGWDLVVSNLPYVTPSEYEHVAPELRHEPRAALVGEGMHEELARVARTRILVLEVGDGQAKRVARALEELGYEEVTITPDLAGRERVVEGTRR